jgi:hypothetical protein
MPTPARASRECRFMVVFQTAKLRRGVRMFRATRSTAGSRQIITIFTTSSVFRAPGQPPTRSALLTPNWRGCEGMTPGAKLHTPPAMVSQH